jgi:hypothetical protein
MGIMWEQRLQVIEASFRVGATSQIQSARDRSKQPKPASGGASILTWPKSLCILTTFLLSLQTRKVSPSGHQSTKGVILPAPSPHPYV